MKNLRESILSDMEDTIKVGDNLNKIYKKAEKDWNKLISKTKGNIFGTFYEVTINSEALTQILGMGHPIYQHFAYEYESKYGRPYPYKIDKVSLIYYPDDAFNGKHLRHIQLQIGTRSITGRMAMTLIASHLNYCGYNETIPNTVDGYDSVTLEKCVEIISAAFKSKYKTLDDVKQAFLDKDNIKYTAKI
jgi:hypothetical protein